MNKTTYPVNIPYTFDPIHKGAPYTFNEGENWVNHGEFCEIICKSVLGYAPIKEANGTYDTTDDIPELTASVKSSKATLVNRKLGYDFASVKAHYMATVHSTSWIWVSVGTEEATLYTMDKNEFSDFLDAYAVYDPDRRVIRFKSESNKMLRYLDEKVVKGD